MGGDFLPFFRLSFAIRSIGQSMTLIGDGWDSRWIDRGRKGKEGGESSAEMEEGKTDKMMTEKGGAKGNRGCHHFPPIVCAFVLCTGASPRPIPPTNP
ncbi:hypothetical protein niasHS_002306 [Heterodera schachtii]|uniref:Uncharacterized protein n=1 Tax=Heterodera schachtii TaxID=97005 RepID=A0ABD2KKH1_HETSC